MALYIILPITIICFTLLPGSCFTAVSKMLISNTSGFSIDLIQRDSPFSHISIPSTTDFDRLHNAFRRSFSRLGHYQSTLLAQKTVIQSRIIPSEGEYLMNISIGTPPVQLIGIADTGSDLIWTQCKPCTECFKQTPTLFDPDKSSTYHNIPCAAKPCTELYQATCSSEHDTCEYSYSYGDRSYTKGNLAAETFTVGETSLPKVVFGCGHDNGGTFDESGSGLIGLGGGSLSLVSQLGKTIGGKFSYCLVPLSAESYVTSKISFGSAAVVSGSGVVSTPLVSNKDPKTYYYLTLEAISVGKKRLVYDTTNYNTSTSSKAGVAANEGNIIIDSGTTLTFLPAGFYDDLVSVLEKAIDAEKVSDPQGVLSLCFRSDSSISVPTIKAHFTGADVVLNPLNTFAKVEDDMFCFTMAPSTDFAIFGNLAQMNFLVGYDIDGGTVSFKPTDCSRMTI
ncbi:aspartic proteinase CDR1-like [Humulus lupulus]|uniref:aspartic proteinase CDR1-like n=1 Tax=Humulus lupulus TaxID=3486 RepID=UPI002B40AF3F|nr:aspartic proteinase CDR1-like [Humulus lupulus]